MVRPDSETYRRGVRRSLLVTLALSVAVVAGKLIAGLIAGSLSVISDAIHSSVDSLNNNVRLAVMKYTTVAPDESHPYAHARFETLAAFAIAGFLFATCYQIPLSALKRIFAHERVAPEITALTIGVMIGTIIAIVIVTVYERREGRLRTSRRADERERATEF